MAGLGASHLVQLCRLGLHTGARHATLVCEVLDRVQLVGSISGHGLRFVLLTSVHACMLHLSNHVRMLQDCPAFQAYY